MNKLRKIGIGGILMLLVMVIAAGCSSDKSAEAEKLLKTVPADADAVALLNVEKIITETGAKEKDGKIVVPVELQKHIDGMSDKEARKGIQGLLNGESGISMKVICIFNGTHTLLTGLLDDPTAFKKYIEEGAKTEFAEEGGANVCRNIAYIGNQFWVGLQGLPESSELVRYTKLSKSQSMASHVYADKLMELDDDLTGIADLGRALGTVGRNRAQISMAMAALFDKATLLSFTGNLGKDEIEGEVNFLNAKGEPAKYLLPTGKIDTKTIENLGGKAQTVIAGQIPAGLVSKITSMFKSFGGGLPESLTTPLEEIEGTLAFASGPEGMTGVVSTKGTPSPQLVELVGNQTRMVVTTDGKKMLLNKGTAPGGEMEISGAAKYFKDSMFGAVGRDIFGIEIENPEYLEGVMVKPEDGSLEINIFVKLGQGGGMKILEKLF